MKKQIFVLTILMLLNTLRDSSNALAIGVSASHGSLGSALDAVAAKTDKLSASLSEATQGIRNSFNQGIDSIAGYATDVKNVAKSAISDAYDDFTTALNDKITSLKDTLSSSKANVEDSLRSFGEAVQNTFQDFADKVSAKINDLKVNAKGAVADALDSLGTKLKSAAESVRSTVSDAVETFKTAASDVIDSARAKLSSESAEEAELEQSGGTETGSAVTEAARDVQSGQALEQSGATASTSARSSLTTSETTSDYDNATAPDADKLDTSEMAE